MFQGSENKAKSKHTSVCIVLCDGEWSKHLHITQRPFNILLEPCAALHYYLTQQPPQHLALSLMLLPEERDIQEPCHRWTPPDLSSSAYNYQFISCSNAKYVTPTFLHLLFLCPCSSARSSPPVCQPPLLLNSPPSDAECQLYLSSPLLSPPPLEFTALLNLFLL